MARIEVAIRNIRDTWIDSNAYNANTAFGRSTSLTVGSEYLGSSTPDGVLLSVFDVPAFPGRKPISIKLNCATSVTGLYTRTVKLYFANILEPWDEFTVTHNTGPKRSSFILLEDATWPQTNPVGGTAWFDIDLTKYTTIEQLSGNGISLLATINTNSGSSESVRISSSEDRANPCYFTAIYADAPRTPLQNSPLTGDVIDSAQVSPVRFEWTHNPSLASGFPQKAYNLQISSDSVNWETYPGTTTNQYADIDVSSLPIGNFFWRIQTIDTDDVPSDYSGTQIVFRGIRPNAPSIIQSVFTSAWPTISWTTDFTQSAYQIQVLLGQTVLIDSFASTTEQSFVVPVRLENDTQYIIRIRAQNEMALFSEWAEEAISTDYEMPGMPTFLAVKKNGGIEISIANDFLTKKNAIYRRQSTDEWVLIGYAEPNGTFVDYTAAHGDAEYFVEAIGNSGASVSAPEAVQVVLHNGYLASAENPGDFVDIKWNVRDDHDGEYGGILTEYAGRERPVVEFDEHVRRTISISCSSLSFSEFDALNAMLKKKEVMLFRNRKVKIYGICNVVTYSRNNTTGTVYELSLTISEVEYKEGAV